MNEDHSDDPIARLETEIRGCFIPSKEIPTIEVKFSHGYFYTPESIEQRILSEHFGFGRWSGDKFILSPYEVYFLADVCESIIINMSKEELWSKCVSLFKSNLFQIHYFVYKFYRCNLWIIKDGSVFGSDFVLYSDHPSKVHSSFCINILPNWENVKNDIAITTRICWTVKKSEILCVVNCSKVTNILSSECIDEMSLQPICVKRAKFR